MIAILLYLAAGLLPFAWSGKAKLPSPGALFACGLAFAQVAGFLSLLVSGSLLPMTVLLIGALIASVVGMLLNRPSLNSTHACMSSADRPTIMLSIVVLLAALVLLARIAGTPIVMYDVLSYHIPLARQVAGWDAAVSPAAVFGAPGVFYARMPLAAAILESPFTAPRFENGLGVGLPIFIGACIVASAFCGARIAALLGGRHVARILSAVLCMLHPLAQRSLLQGVYDPAVALMALAGVELTLTAATRRGGVVYALLAGCVAGSAAAIKLSAIGTVILPVAIVAGGAVIARRQSWRPVAFVALGLVIAFGPWLVRATVIGGHPMHPFRGEAAGWTRHQGRFVVESHDPVTPKQRIYWSDAATKVRHLGYPLPGTPVSLLLILALAGIAVRRSRPDMLLLAAALGGYAAWLTVRQNPDRFLLPAALLLVPVAARAVESVSRPGWTRFAWAAGALLLAAPSAAALLPSLRDIPAVYTADARAEQMGQLMGPEFLRVTRGADAAATLEDGKLILFFEARGALFPAGAEYATVWDQAVYAADLRSSTTADQFGNRLAERGITHILVNEFEWGRLVDFYAPESRDDEELHWRAIGLGSPRARDALAAYPPHRFAGLTEQDLTVLLEFLRSHRRRAQAAISAGPVAEIWYAPLEQAL